MSVNSSPLVLHIYASDNTQYVPLIAVKRIIAFFWETKENPVTSLHTRWPQHVAAEYTLRHQLTSEFEGNPLILLLDVSRRQYFVYSTSRK